MPTMDVPKISQLRIDEDLHAVNALSPGLYIEDIGKKWKDLGVIAGPIRAMAYCGNGIVVLGGDDYHVYRSTDYGATWTDLGVITSSDVIYTIIYCGNGIALFGDDASHVWRSTDYGATWTDLGVKASAIINAMAYLGDGAVHRRRVSIFRFSFAH